MLGPRYIPTSKQKIFSDMDYEKHRKKLEEIEQDDRKKRTINPEVEKRKKLNHMRVQNFKFQHLEKSQAIDKDNQILLGRLVEISKQKKSKLVPVKSEASLSTKTLNAPYRKRELERIANENEALARRLLSQNSKFSMKRLEDDFEKHRVLLKQVQKLTPSPTIKGKLPPLHVHQGSETSKAANGKKIKLPERKNPRSVSSDEQHNIRVETEDIKKEEIPTNIEQSVGNEKATDKTEPTKVTNTVNEEIADETEAHKKENVKPENKTVENNSRSNLDKKETNPPALEKKETLKKQPTIAEKKTEDIKTNGDKKDTLVNIDNKGKDVAGSQNTLPEKNQTSANPSKQDINNEKKN